MANNTLSLIDPDAILDEEDEFKLHATVIEKLDKDLKLAAKTISDQEAAYMVRDYYAMQELRIIAHNRAIALQKLDKPYALSDWLARQNGAVEAALKITLDLYSSNHPLGAWPRSVFGIGPVITAGLLAHTHMNHMTSPAHLWSFAGLNPNMIWKKGQQRPFNADLRVLAYKIGESFIKFQNNPKDFYGKYFAQYKKEYTQRNDEGKYTQRAADIITAGHFRPTTEAHKHYTAGHLPPAHIHAMARRKTAKLFLSHYWQVSYELHFKRRAPHLHVEVYLGHADIIPPPNWTSQYPYPKIVDTAEYNLKRPF